VLLLRRSKQVEDVARVCRYPWPNTAAQNASSKVLACSRRAREVYRTLCTPLRDPIEPIKGLLSTSVPVQAIK
jgi:hypothetical protein